MENRAGNSFFLIIADVFRENERVKKMSYLKPTIVIASIFIYSVLGSGIQEQLLA